MFSFALFCFRLLLLAFICFYLLLLCFLIRCFPQSILFIYS
nr:MAG TPA: hypothetical protein [Caudoviricetes sp.]